jgi:AraC-like DNA-binding protein
VVVFYNNGQTNQRGTISERGDFCEFFSFEPAVLRDALRPYVRQIDDHYDLPFQFTHGPSDATSYLIQRRVVEYILAEEHPDPLFVEETMIGVLRQTISTVYQERGETQPTACQREIVRAAQALLSTRFDEPLTIDGIARQLNYSPYHLCRIFRRLTGLPVHQYLNQIRLRTALEWLSGGGVNLTDLALRLCFSSHSHFTLAFRKTYGAPPSAIRDIPVANHLQKMRKFLIA